MLSLVVIDPLDVVALVVFVLVLLFTDYRPAWWLSRKAAVYELKSRAGVRSVPGPPAFPIIGTRWLYSVGYYKIDKIHEVYQDLHKKYGPIVKEEALWNYPVISVFAAKDIEKVLRYPSKYPLRPPTEVTAYYRSTRPDRYTNLGLVNEQGETWHQLRTALTPALTSAATMQRFLPELNQVADDFNQLLQSSRDKDGTVHAFEELANRMGLESTCTLILGRRMGFLEHQLDPTAARLAQAIQVQFCASRDTFYGLPFWKLFPTAAYKQLIKSENTIYDVISELVDSALREELETCETDAVKSVFMSILQAHSLDVRDKKAGIIDFIAAGIKTLGNTLVFLLYLIAKNPRVQKRLYDEIVTLAPLGTPVTSQVLRDAVYLRACIMEAFRVLPTAPCVARLLETDMELSGHQIKAGSVILCQTWIASQQKENFKRPTEFLPERWLSKEQCPCKTSQPHLKNDITKASQAHSRDDNLQTSQAHSRDDNLQTSQAHSRDDNLQTSQAHSRDDNLQTSQAHSRDDNLQTSQAHSRDDNLQTSQAHSRDDNLQTSQARSRDDNLQTSQARSRDDNLQTSQARSRDDNLQTSQAHSRDDNLQTSQARSRDDNLQTSQARSRDDNLQTSQARSRYDNLQTSQAHSRDDNLQTSQAHSRNKDSTSRSSKNCPCNISEPCSNGFLVAPFGVGKRMCPGKRFVHLELQVVLAQTVRQFEIQHEGELNLQFEFLLAPAAKTNFILKDRC